MNILTIKSGGMAIMAGALMLSTSAFGATVGAGTFNLGGTAMGSSGGVTFYFIAPGDNNAIVQGPELGVFTDLTPGTTGQVIQPLTSANGVTPGTSFDFMNFITLTDGVQLDVTSVPIPAGFSACPASGTVAVGTECLVNAASPVLLTQNANGVSARLDLSGQAHFVGQTTYTPYTAEFTAPSTNFSTIAAFQDYFDTHGGSIPAVSYAASFTTTTTTSPVPEPGTLAIVALGLIGCGFYRRGKKSAVR